MVNRYHRLLADPRAADRWHLGSPLDGDEEIDPRIFTYGRAFPAGNVLTVPVARAGRPQDFNFADFDMPVVRRDISSLFEAQVGKAVQRVPARLKPPSVDFDILNVLDVVDCVDKKKSELMKWTEQDGRSDKVGQYRMITKLVLDPSRAAGHRMFRISGWLIALIVDEGIKRLLQEKEVKGVVFQAVS